jgi:hypothetical protein
MNFVLTLEKEVKDVAEKKHAFGVFENDSTLDEDAERKKKNCSHIFRLKL